MKKCLSIIMILMGLFAFATSAQAATSIKKGHKTARIAKKNHKAKTVVKEEQKEETVHHPHWSYKGEYAPENWGKIHGNETCSLGGYQVPVDIRGAIATPNVADLRFEYTGQASDVVNNGHSIQVNFVSGSKLYLGDKAYNLVQVHFHTPSEFTIEGKQFPMVAHFVHKSDQGALLVFALMFENGQSNPVIEKIWSKMPKTVNEKSNLNVVDVSSLVAGINNYYRLDGSLTTPPCSEGVTWIVAKPTVVASQQQFTQFTNVIGINNRPLQPLNGRLIIEK